MAVDWTIETTPENRYLVIRTGGRFTVEENLEMVTAILAHPAWRPGTATLFDHRALDMGQAGYEAMIRAAAIHRAHEDQIGGGKAALVMGSAGAFGTGRQYEMLLSGETATRLRIFTDLEEARRWLEG
jgi:hypothetical protein